MTATLEYRKLRSRSVLRSLTDEHGTDMHGCLVTVASATHSRENLTPVGYNPRLELSQWWRLKSSSSGFWRRVVSLWNTVSKDLLTSIFRTMKPPDKTWRKEFGKTEEICVIDTWTCRPWRMQNHRQYTLKIEASRSFETFLFYRNTTLRHIPEDLRLESFRYRD
jgi:hypothetical protein